jgi:error-prone DNA polymerase
MAEGRLERLPQAGGAINVYVRSLRALVTPEDDAADVVALAERRAAAAAAAAGAEGPARGTAQSAAAVAGAADFRGVAPAIQSFAAGRRR